MQGRASIVARVRLPRSMLERHGLGAGNDRDELGAVAKAPASGSSSRRVDGVLLRLRRTLPEGAVVTVRGRGWAFDVHRIGTSRKRGSPLPETPAP